MAKLFDPESGAGNLIGMICDIFLLSICWLLCSVPIFTIGAASTALYDAVVHGFRFKEGGIYARFFRTFRREFGLSTLCWLMWLALIALSLYAYMTLIVGFGESGMTLVFTALGLAAILIPLGISCWVFPVLSRFTYNFGGLNKAAAAVAGVNILYTLIIIASLILAIVLCLWLWLPILFMPALLNLFWSVFMEKGFTMLMPEEE